MFPRLIVITDAALAEDDLLTRLHAVLALGPEVGVQLRLPGQSGRAIYERALRMKAACAGAGNPLFINGRIDVALAIGAHVHLPVDAPRPRELRRFFPRRWITASVHSDEEAVDAEGADLALLAPAFSPFSKPGDTRPALGPEGIARLASRLPGPALALGGITPENAGQLRGVHGVAAIGSVLHAPDPAGVARALLAAMARR